MIIKISSHLDKNWFYAMLTFDLLTKLLICLLHILIIKLCWKFDDKSSNGKFEFQVNWVKIDDFRWCWLLTFWSWNKNINLPSPYSQNKAFFENLMTKAQLVKKSFGPDRQTEATDRFSMITHWWRITLKNSQIRIRIH